MPIQSRLDYLASLLKRWHFKRDERCVYDNSLSSEAVSVASGERDTLTTVLNQDSWIRFLATKP